MAQQYLVDTDLFNKSFLQTPTAGLNPPEPNISDGSTLFRVHCKGPLGCNTTRHVLCFLGTYGRDFICESEQCWNMLANVMLL